MREVQRTADALVEELANVCSEALKGVGFQPSERLLEKIQEEIKYSLRLG